MAALRLSITLVAAADASPLDVTRVIHLLLEAGADPTLVNASEWKPLEILQKSHPNNFAAYALLHPDTLIGQQHALFLVKARHFVIAPARNPAPAWAAERLQRHEPLPHVELVAAAPDEDETTTKLRATLGFLVGLLGGAGGKPLPCSCR